MKELISHILLDAARMEDLMQTAKELNTFFDSFYRGRSEEDLEAVAPYLFSFPGNDAFAKWIHEEGWGNSWGVIVETGASFEDCWKHFRKFLLVKTEEGEELYFRFYDPRVLKIFLPTCDKNQLVEFFGPVDSFVAEGDDNETSVRFFLVNGELVQKVLSTASVFGMLEGLIENAQLLAGKKRQQIIVVEDDEAPKKK